MKTKALILFCLMGLALSCTKQGKLDNYDIADLVPNFQSSVAYSGGMDKPSSVSISFNMSTDLHDLDYGNPHNPADYETTGVRFSWEMDVFFYHNNGSLWDDFPFYSYRFSSEEYQNEQAWADEILLTEYMGTTGPELDTACKHSNKIRCLITCSAEVKFLAVHGEMRREALENHELIIE